MRQSSTNPKGKGKESTLKIKQLNGIYYQWNPSMAAKSTYDNQLLKSPVHQQTIKSSVNKTLSVQAAVTPSVVVPHVRAESRSSASKGLDGQKMQT